MSKSILLAEDDMALSMMYSKSLANAGFKVDVAHDGIVASEKVMAGGYDLILLDIMLPHKDGLTILKELNESKPTGLAVPVVVMSNLAKDTIVEEAISLGAVACINKLELTPKQIVEKIQKILS